VPGQACTAHARAGRYWRGQDLQASTPRRVRRTARLLSVVTALAVVLAGCSPEVRRGWMPGYEDGQVTNQTGRITDLWVNSWIALLIVGAITWGLMIWCIVVYRKRKGDERLPVQLRYHVPLEIMYIVLPLLMVGVFFYYTARDMAEIEDVSQEPRSEEHTSELQSRENLVCRLLLEKKK